MPVSRTKIRSLSGVSSAPSVTLPPAFEYLIAFVNRLFSATRSRPLSTNAAGKFSGISIANSSERSRPLRATWLNASWSRSLQVHALPLELQAAHLDARDVEQVVDQTRRAAESRR